MRSKSEFEKVHGYIENLMHVTEKTPQGVFPFPWFSTTAGQFYSKGVVCWDYHHQSMRSAAGGKPESLRYFLGNMLKFQQESGFIPCSLNTKNGIGACVGTEWHAQPWIAQNAAVYLAMTGDTETLESHFDAIALYLRFWMEHYRSPFGLFHWSEGWMSGIDNEAAQTMYPPFSLLPPDLPSLLYLECHAMAYIAEKIGRDGSSYTKKAEEIAKNVNEMLWDEEMGIYSCYNVLEGHLQTSWNDGRLSSDVGRYAYVSAPALLVLFSGIAPKNRAERMIREYVLNPKHFRSKFGIRSLSASSEYYNNAVWGNPPRYGDWARMTNSNWQGPVWIPIQWFTFHGLLHYGFRKEAGELADDVISLLARSIEERGSMTENYNAETGDGLYAENFASWNTLADTMYSYLGEGPMQPLPLFPFRKNNEGALYV